MELYCSGTYQQRPYFVFILQDCGKRLVCNWSGDYPEGALATTLSWPEMWPTACDGSTSRPHRSSGAPCRKHCICAWRVQLRGEEGDGPTDVLYLLVDDGTHSVG